MMPYESVHSFAVGNATLKENKWFEEGSSTKLVELIIIKNELTNYCEKLIFFQHNRRFFRATYLLRFE